MVLVDSSSILCMLTYTVYLLYIDQFPDAVNGPQRLSWQKLKLWQTQNKTKWFKKRCSDLLFFLIFPHNFTFQPSLLQPYHFSLTRFSFLYTFFSCLSPFRSTFFSLYLSSPFPPFLAAFPFSSIPSFPLTKFHLKLSKGGRVAHLGHPRYAFVYLHL